MFSVLICYAAAAASVLVEEMWIQKIHQCGSEQIATALQCEEHAALTDAIYEMKLEYDRPIGCCR